MRIAFDGFMQECITFNSALASTDELKPVKISASSTVALSADTQQIHGKAIKVEKDGAVTVQLKGYVEFTYSGTGPAVGYAKLAADGTGKVKVDATNGREFLVMKVDTTAKVVGFLL